MEEKADVGRGKKRKDFETWRKTTQRSRWLEENFTAQFFCSITIYLSIFISNIKKSSIFFSSSSPLTNYVNKETVSICNPNQIDFSVSPFQFLVSANNCSFGVISRIYQPFSSVFLSQ
jgi:hypothetical protein